MKLPSRRARCVQAGRIPRKRFASASSPVDGLIADPPRMTDPFSSDGAKTPPKPFTSEQGRRQIRSFVLRQGRFSPAQQRAFEQHWARFGLDFGGTLRDFDAVFGRKAARVLEIGFGNGEALRFAAQHDRTRDYIGIEVHAPGVGRLLNALAQDDCDHVRLYHHDAVEVLIREIADGSLDEIRIYFPDPWHKKRHHKRRLLQRNSRSWSPANSPPTAACNLATDGRTRGADVGCSMRRPACATRRSADSDRARTGARRRISRRAGSALPWCPDLLYDRTPG